MQFTDAFKRILDLTLASSFPFHSASSPLSRLNIPMMRRVYALLLFAFKSNLYSYFSSTFTRATADGKGFRNHFSLELNVSFTHLLFVSRLQTKVGWWTKKNEGERERAKIPPIIYCKQYVHGTHFELARCVPFFAISKSSLYCVCF